MPPREALRVKLDEVRHSRALAEKKGSYTNVPALHKTELEILKLLCPVAVEAADPMLSMSDADIVAMIVGALPELPRNSIDEVRAAMDALHPPLRLVK